MTRRALLRLLSLLPFAPLAKAAPVATAACHPAVKAAILGAGYGMGPERALRLYGSSIVVDRFEAEQFRERQRRSEAAWAAELYKDGAP